MMGKDIFKKKPRRRLKSLSDCRRVLAGVINDFQQEKITESEAKTIGYLINILGQLIEKGELEIRLKALESAWEENQNGKFNHKNR